MKPRASTRDALAARTRGGFTLIELLVVISLLTILLAIAVPAFSGLLYSSERSMADSKIKIAATLGRDAAVRAGRGDDGAVAFFFEPGGRARAVPFVKVGVLNDLNDAGDVVQRDVFVKVDLFESIEMPRNWSVRGYATPNSIDDDWYNDTYTGATVREQGNWVFPETGFFDPQDDDDQGYRQTFLIRFDAGSGTASVPTSRDALLLDPSPSRTLRTTGVFATYNVEKFSSHRAYVQQVLQLTNDNDKRALLGDRSPDTVLARQVTQVCVYDEQRLAGKLKVRLDRATGSLYKAGERPEFVDAPATLIQDINEWIESPDSEVVATGDQKPEQEAKVYFVERYSGSLREMFP